MTAHADATAQSLSPGRLPSRPRGIAGSRVSTRESLRFLTDVSNALAASLDYPSTLQKVAELTVPRLACYCELDLIDDGKVERVGVAGRGAKEQEILARAPIVPGREVCAGLVTDVLSSGRSLLVNEAGPDHSTLPSCSRDPVALLRETGATSLLLVPLIARGRPLGVLLLASTRVDRCYGEEDLALAEEVARIAALAIDNARLYAEANRAIMAREDILRVVSHDLRNPIGAMASAASVVLESAPDVPCGSTHRLLKTIVRASKQASRMIDDLLDLARIDSGRLSVDPQPEALSPIVTEAVEMHAPIAVRRAVRLRYVGTEPTPVVMVDRERLLQLLGNLLSNAIRFTPPEGEIEIAVEVVGEEVVCTVADSGAGIPSEKIPHVFDRFWQADPTDRAGLGLGLAIVRAIVEAHGGRVWAESELGKGTTFGFSLRLAETLDASETP